MSATKPRILVVDDEPSMLHTLTRVLGSQYTVECSRGPREAMAASKTFEPDLVLLDIRMPEMTGFELMEHLKAARPGLDVIFMTGSISQLDAQLVRTIRAKAFYFIQKPFDREVLLTLIERCLELRFLHGENHRHVKRLERELAEARLFQHSLLPPSRARVQGISVDARYVPCVELAGDFYDFAQAGPDRATFLISDVSGHGVSAAMLTGMIKSAFHASGVDDYDPVSVVERIASGVRGFGTQRFITLLCARISTKPPRVEFVSAGHPPAIVWSPDSDVTMIESNGPLVAAGLSDQHWSMDTVDLPREARMLLLTDGITEVEGGDGSFGMDRVIAGVKQHPAAGAALLDSLLDEARAFAAPRPIHDDMTLLALRLT